MTRGMRKGPLQFKRFQVPAKARFHPNESADATISAARHPPRKKLVEKWTRQGKIGRLEELKLGQASLHGQSKKFQEQLEIIAISNHLRKILDRSSLALLKTASHLEIINDLITEAEKMTETTQASAKRSSAMRRAVAFLRIRAIQLKQQGWPEQERYVLLFKALLRLRH